MVKKAASTAPAPEPEVVQAKVELVVPKEPTEVSEEDKANAQRLDKEINEKIQRASNTLAEAYLDLAESLKQMKSTKGYKLIGHTTWGNYLESKTEFGRAYLFFLAKLGESDLDQLRAYLGKGLHASKFISFAKTSVAPEKIPQLISATWERIKDKSVRDTNTYLKDYLQEHPELQKPKAESTSGKRRGRVKSPWISKIKTQFNRLGDEDRAEYIKALKEFLKAHK
jgi:hypothetical protein